MRTGLTTDLRFGDGGGDGGCKSRKGKRKEEETGSDFEIEHCLQDSVLIAEERTLRLDGWLQYLYKTKRKEDLDIFWRWIRNVGQHVIKISNTNS